MKCDFKWLNNIESSEMWSLGSLQTRGTAKGKWREPFASVVIIYASRILYNAYAGPRFSPGLLLCKYKIVRFTFYHLRKMRS